MKELFQRELAILDMVKTIRLKDINLVGAALSILIMIIYLIKNSHYYTFTDMISTSTALLLLVVILISWRNKSNERDVKAFTFIQIIVLLINFLLNWIFPASLGFLKVLLNSYIILNFFMFILGNLYDYKPEKKELKEKKQLKNENVE